MGHRKLFIADDEPSIQRVYARLLKAPLETSGVEVRIFGDGTEVLEAALKDGMPEVVLTDDRMLRMSGRELAAKLRGLGYDGKIIMVSATALRDGLPDGIDDFLAKPFTASDILAAVRRFIL